VTVFGTAFLEPVAGVRHFIAESPDRRIEGVTDERQIPCRERSDFNGFFGAGIFEQCRQ
jgi:hypothetical protein